MSCGPRRQTGTAAPAIRSPATPRPGASWGRADLWQKGPCFAGSGLALCNLSLLPVNSTRRLHRPRQKGEPGAVCLGEAHWHAGYQKPDALSCALWPQAAVMQLKTSGHLPRPPLCICAQSWAGIHPAAGTSSGRGGLKCPAPALRDEGWAAVGFAAVRLAREGR